ncbi:unannotated protein [freshwater metagenome]|uniref:Unannotated protein n=1 Tax=freshwater metagenome TaxID=449393 RepID=A0A6J7JKD0_9ZZZZ
MAQRLNVAGFPHRHNLDEIFEMDDSHGFDY